MLRDKSLIPLSHQHQHALALCVRIDRASPIPDADLPAWQAEIAQIFQGEITAHFAAEEQVLFPAARALEGLSPLVDDLLSDHAWLRQQFQRAISAATAPDDLRALARRLSEHIRKEERQLFEQMQGLLNGEQLATLGKTLAETLRQAEQACILPTQATRLRAKET